MAHINEITYNEEVDNAYISLTSEPCENVTTLSLENRSILLDFDGDDRLVGIESINASHDFPQDLLDEAQHLESSSIPVSELKDE